MPPKRKRSARDIALAKSRSSRNSGWGMSNAFDLSFGKKKRKR